MLTPTYLLSMPWGQCARFELQPDLQLLVLVHGHEALLQQPREIKTGISCVLGAAIEHIYMITIYSPP